MASEQLPKPGWYPNPDNEDQLRFWDGKEWTDRVDDRQSQQPSSKQLLVIVLYLFAALFFIFFSFMSWTFWPSVWFVGLAVVLGWVIIKLSKSRAALYAALALWLFLACPVSTTVVPWTDNGEQLQLIASGVSPGDYPGNNQVPQSFHTLYLKGVAIGKVKFSTQPIVHISSESDSCKNRLEALGFNWFPYPNLYFRDIGNIGVDCGLIEDPGDYMTLQRTEDGDLVLKSDPDKTPFYGHYSMGLGLNRNWAVWVGWIIIGLSLFWRTRRSVKSGS